MLFDAESEPSLKAWLVRTLEPMCVGVFSCRNNVLTYAYAHCSCDADPGALSDYVLALLKHNLSESELRKELGTQLEEFLEKGALVLLCVCNVY
jgi:RNA-binding protein 26